MVATRAPTAAPVAAAPAEPTVAPTPAPPVAPAPAPAPVAAAEPPKPKRPAVVVASPETRGVLAIGGERFLKGEVLVDGRSVGFAPRQLELSSGTHQVEIVLVDGTRVGPRALTIGPQHTESFPQRWVE